MRTVTSTSDCKKSDRKQRRKKSIRYDKYGYIFILPFFAALILFQLYPNFYTIFLSFTDMKGMLPDFDFVAFEQYIWLWKNVKFWRSLENTALIWIINFVPQLTCALLFAYIFTNRRIHVRGKNIWKAVFYMPNILTAAAVALLFASLFGHPFGTFTIIFRKLGWVSEDFQFMLDPWATRLIVCFIQFLMWTGPTMIMLVSGMIGINDSLYEAAMLDGASDGRMFFSITLPLIRPIMLYTLVTSLVGGLQVFDVPYLFNGGGLNSDFSTTTITIFIYELAFTGENNFGASAAASVYLLIVAALCSVALFKIMNRREKDGR